MVGNHKENCFRDLNWSVSVHTNPTRAENRPRNFSQRNKRHVSSCKWIYVLIYIEDVIIFSSSLPGHIGNVETVLKLIKISSMNLKCKNTTSSQALSTIWGVSLHLRGCSRLTERKKQSELSDAQIVWLRLDSSSFFVMSTESLCLLSPEKWFPWM